MRTAIFWIFFPLVFVALLNAQQVQVNRENRTIAVNATETVNADADVATISLGYHNYGVAQKETYDANVRASVAVLDSLAKAGITKDQIETGTIRVDSVDPEKEWTEQQKKERQYEAKQGWKIRVAASDAGKVVDLAMHSGANELEEISWDVRDRAALQAKAGGAALSKARAIADQMANGLGAKLGTLVYASNIAASTPLFLSYARVTVNTSVASVRRQGNPEVSLFPEKVKQEATVYAVFAIE